MRVCLATDPRCAWEDREARPYDAPICDFELPAAQARKLSGFEFGRVVSSPFRRCLQTAAVRRITAGLVLLAPGLALLCSALGCRLMGHPGFCAVPFDSPRAVCLVPVAAAPPLVSDWSV